MRRPEARLIGSSRESFRKSSVLITQFAVKAGFFSLFQTRSYGPVLKLVTRAVVCHTEANYGAYAVEQAVQDAQEFPACRGR
jgi:hypothetical protein